MEIIPDILEIASDIAGDTIQKRCGTKLFRYIYLIFLSILYVADITMSMLWIQSMWFMMDVTPWSGGPPTQFYSFHNGTDYTDFGLGDNAIATFIALSMTVLYGIWLTTSMFAMLFAACFQSTATYELMMGGQYGTLFDLYVHSPLLILVLIRRWSSGPAIYEIIKNTGNLRFGLLFLIELPSLICAIWTMILPQYNCVQQFEDELSYKYTCTLDTLAGLDAYAVFTAVLAAIVIIKVTVEQAIMWRKRSKLINAPKSP